MPLVPLFKEEIEIEKQNVMVKGNSSISTGSEFWFKSFRFTWVHDFYIVILFIIITEALVICLLFHNYISKFYKLISIYQFLVNVLNELYCYHYFESTTYN